MVSANSFYLAINISKKQVLAQQLFGDGAAQSGCSPASDDYRTSQRKIQQGQAEKCETMGCTVAINFPFADSIFFLLQQREREASLNFAL